jgi:hypothetical protein
MRRPSTAFCCLLVAFVAVTGTFQCAWSQEVTAAIVGTVTDPSGAPIKGATVTATDAERGTQWPATTNDSGAYNLPRLPIGTYSVKVTAAGFQTSVEKAFTLVLNQTARVDIQMKVGKITETVEVTGAAPVLQTESTQVSTVIDAQANDDLPLATRDYVELTMLAPGAVSPDPDNFNTGSNTANGARPYINGNREQANNFLLDGMDNNQVSDNLVGYTPAPDAIQEFNLITSNASAEFGNFQGGIVSATIKSGTNRFHGDLWEFFRNDKLNANSWSNNFNGLRRSLLRWNMFGGSVGGPIVRDKLFFFFDYQGQRFDFPSSTSPISVFTTAERTGNFGDICAAGFDSSGICLDRSPGPSAPSNQVCNPGATIGASTCVVADQLYNPVPSLGANPTPFANNQITNPIDPVASALFASSLYPQATGTSRFNNATNTTATLSNDNQYDIKIDFVATKSDHIFGRYSHASAHNPSINSFALFGTGFNDSPIQNTVVDWSHTFSSHLLNDVRAGVNYVRLHNGTNFASSVGDLGNTLGIGNGNPAGLPGLLSIGFGNVLSSVGSSGVEQKFDDAVIQLSDTLIVTHDRHLFHAGFEFWRARINTFYTGNNGALGSINFNGNFTTCNPGGLAVPPASCDGAKSTGGYGGADFYLGLPINYGRGISGGEWGQRQSIFGAYLQDDWRVTNNLTFNLGLRYEAHTPWTERKSEQTNFDLISGQLIAPNCSIVTPLLGTAPVTCQQGSAGLYDGTYGLKDFQPRVGFAWTPAKLGGNTVVRGAFTISSYMEGTGTNLRLPINPPFTPAETFVNYNALAFPTTNTQQGLVPVGAATDPFAGALVRVWDPHVQPAITQQWNLTIQHQFTGLGTLQAGYVGQHGTHLMVPMPYLQEQLLPNSACATPPCTAPSIFFSGNPALQKDISQISGTASVGKMKYDALQVVLQKRLSHGLEYQVAYTYSKCMTDNSGYYGTWGDTQGSPASPYYQNLYNPGADYAACYFDLKHSLNAYAVYRLPFGKGERFGHDMNRAVNGVVGNWQVSPIVIVHTGFPVAMYGNDHSGTNSRGARPNCLAGSGHVFGRQNALDSTGKYIGYQWLDPAPYADTSSGTFGDCPAQGPGRGPGYFNTDLSLQKNIPFTETMKLQFRADFINAFNRVNLNSPGTSVPNGSAGGATANAGLGIVSGSQAPRNIQFALKFYF